MGVRFFFEQAKSKISKDFPNVFGGGGSVSKSSVNTAGIYDKILKPYGWLNSLYQLSIDGIFTEKGKNSVESVKDKKLNKVLTYLSWKTAKNDYEVAVQDKIRNPNRVM